MERVLVAWLAGASLLAFAAMGFDKHRAARGGRRVPESTLLALAAAGGFVGAWLGSRAFRHKTVKRSFRWRLLAASAVGAALVVLALRYGA